MTDNGNGKSTVFEAAVFDFEILSYKYLKILYFRRFRSETDRHTNTSKDRLLASMIH